MKSSIVKIGKPRTKADRFFRRFPVVLYTVTDAFADSDIGEIREARLIAREGEMGLLYHPSSRDGCGSFDICSKSRYSNWETVGRWPKEVTFVNCDDFYLDK